MTNGAARENFGVTPTGEKVERVTISAGGLTANIITWGAVIQDLRLDGHQPPLVLGFDKFEDYPQYSSYFGATPGRNSNRIDSGRFSIDGKEYQLELNEKGVTHIHGGSDGIGKSNWLIMEHGPSHVVLQIIDPDGRAGYPGNCTVNVTYTIREGGVLSVLYETTTDQPTIANICQHSYFNLDGADTALDHEIMIAAHHYLPTDERQIPTGEIRAVEGTAFDLRSSTPMKREENGEQVLYDHNFCLSPERREKRKVARVFAPASGVALEVHTTEPGVQFYSGFKLNTAVPGLDGRHYGAFAGFCLETQIWPDAVNHPDFPNGILRPGEILRQETDYIFTRG